MAGSPDYRGSILVDDAELRDIAPESLYEIMSVIQQNVFVFNASIRDNVSMFRPFPQEALDQAIRHAHLSELIASRGSDYLCGENGCGLSGGEKQRISIARAMLKNAPIVILDEATAYTDPENEAIIQESVARLVRGKTLIVIAHRLSTITGADNIVLVQDGRIAAQGRHEQLLESSSLYREMWQAHIGAKEGETA